ncbi:hypothetical protein MKX03_022647 [Papaver bracteatum]|nr:hypothetical protein MKX03_022647 [Papaver bracteatum]
MVGYGVLSQKIVRVKRQTDFYRKGFGIGKLNLTTTAKMVQMKLERQRRTQNVEGGFYVGKKRQVFALVDRKSAVYKQPSCEKERLNTLQALLSCPMGSIHTEKPANDILEVQETFPLPIDEQRIPIKQGILLCSPRYTEKLARKIELLGGARYMFLTHKDDVADHKKWSKRLGCHRVLHSQDVEDHTADVEAKLEGSGPWNLGNDFELIHTPGHSKGCVSLFYKPLKVIFTGDHFSKEQSELNCLFGYNTIIIQEWIQKLLDFEFEWILPGHGRRVEFEDTQQKNEAIKAFLTVKGEALGHYI